MLVICLFCLFCPVILARGVEGGLHLLKVKMPPVFGTDEISDLTAISRIIHEASGVEVLVSVKEIGNPLVLAVLRMAEDFDWVEVTSRLAARGHVYSSTPLYSCQHFAGEFNQSFNFTTDVYHDLTNFGHLTFPTRDLSKSEYMTGMAAFMEHVTYKYANSKWDMTCFRSIDLPYEMFTFSNGALPLANMKMAMQMKSGKRFLASSRSVMDVEEIVKTSP